jgi:hypothetical protein
MPHYPQSLKTFFCEFYISLVEEDMDSHPEKKRKIDAKANVFYFVDPQDTMAANTIAMLRNLGIKIEATLCESVTHVVLNRLERQEFNIWPKISNSPQKKIINAKSVGSSPRKKRTERLIAAAQQSSQEEGEDIITTARKQDKHIWSIAHVISWIQQQQQVLKVYPMFLVPFSL